MRNLLIILFFLNIPDCIYSQDVSVSPAKLYYNNGRGENKAQLVTIKNNSLNKQTCQVSFCGFESPGNKGKTKMIAADTDKNSCAKWLMAIPSSFDLNAGESKEVSVVLELPNNDEAEKAKWAIMQLNVSSDKPNQNTDVALSETIKLVIHVFQTPPNLTISKAEIIHFKELINAGDSARTIVLETKNTGKTILVCDPSIELNNMITGEKQNIKTYPFTLLPFANREIEFVLPENLKKGKYSLIGVVDFGNKKNVQSKIEMEIN
jgi:P pilus assembly chaperone PapD